MTRNGKIARLPKAVRDALNRRLAEGEPGRRLVTWLNGLPEVHAALAREFAGRPITENNLSEWKTGGFRDWEAQQDLLAQARRLAEEAEELRSAAGSLADHLAVVVEARLAAELHRSREGAGNGDPREWRRLRALCADVVELRRGDHSAARLQLEQVRRERERERSEAELLEVFVKWATAAPLREVLADSDLSAEQKRRRLRAVFGHGDGAEPASGGPEPAREGAPAGPPASPATAEPPAESATAPAGEGRPDAVPGPSRRNLRGDRGIPADGDVDLFPSRPTESISPDPNREDAGAGAWGDEGKLGRSRSAPGSIRLNPTESGRAYGSAPKLPTVRGG